MIKLYFTIRVVLLTAAIIIAVVWLIYELWNHIR